MISTEWIIYKYQDKWYRLDANNLGEDVTLLNLDRLPLGVIFVSFQVDQLIASISLDAIRSLSIIDFECLDRQVNREGSDGNRDFSHWTVLEMMRHYLNKPDLCFEKNAYIPFMLSLAECFVIMKHISTIEWDRVLTVEVPINRVLFAAEKEGIQLDNTDGIKQQCISLKRDAFLLKNRFQFEHQIYQPDAGNFLGDDNDDIREITRRLEYVAIFGDEERREQAKMYLNLKKIERDFHCLLCIDGYREDELIRPAFKGFGTITSRIIVKNPSLQNLSKVYRHLIRMPAKKYLYLDYSQFEAGILACYCNLKKLKALYKKGTIYKTLGHVAGVDEDEAKILFYRFMYGGRVNDKKANVFFKEYCPTSIIEPIVESFKKQGYVESKFGNRRNVVSDYTPNWLLNHAIQSNASLIFKYALINVAQEYPSLKLILPMHDAALYALPYSFEDVEGVKQCFVKAYQKVFPGLEPIVKQKDFFGEE